MSGYLLLRDNKQTGPYSCEEIIAKGFKAYDLIWAEGKSAGWRYPSEFPEFARHAPVVEEQPFDRFFKKPASSTTNTNLSSSKPTNTPIIPIDNSTAIPEKETQVTIEPEIPKIESRPAKLVAQERKNVFVTLPSTTEPVQPSIHKKPVEQPAPVSRIDEVPEGIITNIEKNTEKSSQIIEPIQEKIVVVPAETLLPKKEEKVPPKSEENQAWEKYNLQSKAEKKPEPKTVETPIIEKRREPVRADKNQLLIRWAIATCLVLGGVVIGLAISNSRQSTQQDLLNRLVKEKIEQSQRPANKVAPISETSNQLNSEPVPPPVEEGKTTPAAQDELVKSAVQTENNPKKSDAIQTIKKEAAPNAAKLEETIEVAEKKPAEPVKKDEAATETARKNIYNLVSVAGNKYKVGVLGGISNLELTLSNNSLYPLDQVEVVVNYHGPENRIVRKESVLISDIAAGEQKVVTVPKSKRGVSVTYSIQKINSKALGLAHAGL